MNWQHLRVQLEEMMDESPLTLTEFRGILSTQDWYKQDPFRTEKWWFGHGAEKSELTFQQMRGFFDFEGLDKPVLMEAIRLQVESVLKDLEERDAQEELVEELEKAIEEDAA